MKHILMVLFFVVGSFAVAKGQDDVAKKLENLETKIEQIDAKIEVEATQKHYEYLEKEFTNYRAELNNDRDHYRKFMEWTTGLVSGIALFILGFFGWKTYKDIKTQTESFKIQMASEAEASYKAKIKEIFDEREKEIIATIAAQTDNAKAKINILFQQINDEYNWQNANILILANGENLSAEEITFKERVKNTTYLEQFDGTIEGNFDVIVYNFMPDATTKEDNNLISLLTNLEAKAKKIPVVVYATNRRFVDGRSLEKLKKYNLYSLANFPITLLAQARDAFLVSGQKK